MHILKNGASSNEKVPDVAKGDIRVNTITEQWIRYAAEADQKCTHAIYSFFITMTIDYHELIKELENNYNNLLKAQAALGTFDAGKYGVTNAISFIESTKERIDSVANTMHLAVFQEFEEDYGHPYAKAWDIVETTTYAECTQKVLEIEALLSVRDESELIDRLDNVLSVDPYNLLMCIWSCAISKTYSPQLFARAQAIYRQLFHECEWDNPDIATACLYVQKRHAGESAVLEKTQELLSQGAWGAAGLRILASAANWLECYEAERFILLQKLNRNLEMLPIELERLSEHTQTCNNAPPLRNVQQGKFTIDVTPLSWDNDAWRGFFEKLHQRRSSLTYALAVSAQENTLRIPKEIAVPNTSNLLHVMKAVFEDEYDGDAWITFTTCTTISDSGEEEHTAYVAQSTECSCMAVLMRLVKIGKNLNIKCYTLYMPQNIPPLQEYKNAIALKDKGSLVVSSWENSLIDTMLSALQKMLNALPMTNLMSEQKSACLGDEIVF